MNKLYLSIPSLDVLFWNEQEDDDFCIAGWDELMKIYAADKEKSLSAKAEATTAKGKIIKTYFEPFEVILESLSKSLGYLTVPTTRWPPGFAGWDKLAQLAKAIFRVAKVAKIEIQGMSFETAYKISKMIIGPCEYRMCVDMRFDPTFSC